MANEFVARNGIIAQNDSIISGSFIVTGGITGSLFGIATTASYVLNAVTASYAATASSADDFTVRGTLTAQTLVVQTITSSILYSSGSNIFGNSLSNTQQMTGSVGITGSLGVTGQLTLGSTITNGTYTYTLPGATGTLALTSALSGYLPLTGGTLTGTLNTTTVANGVNLIGPTGNPSYYTIDQSVNNGGKRWRVGHTGAIGGFSSFDFYNQTDNITPLTLASTGAATFSTSATVGGSSNGRLGVRGTTNDSSAYSFEAANSSGNSLFLVRNDGATTIASSLAVGAITPSATVGRIDASNDIVAFSTSDERLKENIVPITNALDKINKIGGYTFSWKSEEDLVRLHGFTGNDVGVIAQQIMEVLPEVVTTRESGYMAVKYEKLIPLLIEGIKAQQIEINELKELIKNKL